MIQTKPIIKKSFYAKKYNAFYKFINWFIKSNQDNFTNTRFFNALHSYDIENMFHKNVYFSMFDELNCSACFHYEKDRYSETEYQYIDMNAFNAYKNTTYKNLNSLISYLHETTHEKQHDYLVYNDRFNIPEDNEYNKYLNLEFCCVDDRNLYAYKHRLIELDAIYNTVKRMQELKDKGAINISAEYSALTLKECLTFFQHLNNTDDFKDFEDCEPTTKSYYLVEYYKRNFSKSCNSLHKVNYFKYKEIKEINFDKLEEEINQKCDYMKNIFLNHYNALLSSYTPSKEVCKQLKIPEGVSGNNLIKQITDKSLFEVASIVCTDINSYLAYLSDQKQSITEQEKES